MIILAIDPGQNESGWLVYDSESKTPDAFEIQSNEYIRDWLREGGFIADKLIVEMVASYGMPVGKSVFETCVWIGVFVEAWHRPFEYLYRRDVKLYLCNSMRAKDSNVRRALLDKFPATGGGATPQIGTKKQPGPLYGISKDLWAALAIAVTYAGKFVSQQGS